MKNDTMRKEMATELDFNDLDMVSGGVSLKDIYDDVGKIVELGKDIYIWIFH